jgi:hypothetical protein
MLLVITNGHKIMVSKWIYGSYYFQSNVLCSEWTSEHIMHQVHVSVTYETMSTFVIVITVK